MKNTKRITFLFYFCFCSNLNLLAEPLHKTTESKPCFLRADVCFKEILHPNAILVGGITSSFDFYGGVGGFKNFDLYGWPVECKASLLLLNWSRELSKDYFSKVPVNISVSTQLFGMNLGVSIGANLSKEVMYSVFLNMQSSEHIDIDVHRQFGISSFFSQSISTRSELKRMFIENNDLVTGGYIEYREKEALSSAEFEYVQRDIQNHAKVTAEIARAYSKDEEKGSEMLRNNPGDSLLIIGSSGSGKTYSSSDLLKWYVERKNLNSICCLVVTLNEITPTGYVGGRVREEIESAIRKARKDGYSYLQILRAYLLVDEIDRTAKDGTKENEFFSKVQKELQEVVNGHMEIEVGGETYPLKYMLRILPGAYQTEQGRLFDQSKKNVFNKFPHVFSAGIKGMQNYYFDFLHKEEESHKEQAYKLEGVFDEVRLLCYKLGEDIYSASNKIGAIDIDIDKDKDKDKDKILLVSGLYLDTWLSDKGTLKEKEEQLKKVSEKCKELAELMKKESKEAGPDYEERFDSMYSLYLSNLSRLSELSGKNGKDILRAALEISTCIEMRDNTDQFLVSAGLGEEVKRRSAKSYFFSLPFAGDAKKFLKRNVNMSDLGFDEGEIDMFFSKTLASVAKPEGWLFPRYEYKWLKDKACSINKEIEKAKGWLKYRNSGYLVIKDLGDEPNIRWIADVEGVETELNTKIQDIERELRPLIGKIKPLPAICEILLECTLENFLEKQGKMKSHPTPIKEKQEAVKSMFKNKFNPVEDGDIVDKELEELKDLGLEALRAVLMDLDAELYKDQCLKETLKKSTGKEAELKLFKLQNPQVGEIEIDLENKIMTDNTRYFNRMEEELVSIEKALRLLKLLDSLKKTQKELKEQEDNLQKLKEKLNKASNNASEISNFETSKKALTKLKQKILNWLAGDMVNEEI